MPKHQALTHYTEQARIATLEQQRDELAEALRNAVPVLRDAWQCVSGLARSKAAGEAMRKAEAALAKLGDKS